MANRKRKNKNIFFCIVACCLFLLIQGCDGIPMKNYTVADLNAAARRDKNLFNNKSIVNAKLNGRNLDSGIERGVQLEDMTIRDLTLRNVQMKWAHFKNVTFVNCNFIKVNFLESKFENVKFIRGVMFAPDDPNEYEPETSFGEIDIDRLLFDGVQIGKNVSMNFFNGVVVMRNVVVDSGRKIDQNNRSHYTSEMLGGSNLRVRIDHCKVNNEVGINISGDKSSAYITNSTFNNSMIKIKGTASWVENCTITKSDLPSSKTVVIKKSILDNLGSYSSYDDGKVFLVENIYKNHIGASSRVYIYNATIPELGIGSGAINIYDTTIEKLRLKDLILERKFVKYQADKTPPKGITEINLSNVTIGKGDWEGAELQQGKWNNVQLGPVNLKEAQIGVIDGYRVGYFGSDLKFRESPQPLPIDKPPVPTLEELGLAQFWKENDFPQEQY